MTLSEFCYKSKRKIYGYYFRHIRKKEFTDYCACYASYRHSLKIQGECVPNGNNYIAARPNPGAGIGHQMANWMAGYHLSALLGLRFAHIPFSNSRHPFVATEWDNFLGLGREEESYHEVLKQGYKRVLLPVFDEKDSAQLAVIRKIIASYAEEKVVFLCEQDQFYRDLQTLIPMLQAKFWQAPARVHDRLLYDKNEFNIAVHVRRGDIMNDSQNPNLLMRYLSNDYYEKVVHQVLERVKDKKVRIWLFSQGCAADYPEFAAIPNLHWCLDMGAMDSFLHMVYADMLITSKSSFSYKPALLNKGIKICPRHFWHGYLDSEDWIMADNEGNIEWK